MVWPHALASYFQAQVIQVRERAQVRAIKGSIGHVEVFRMDGVGISIIERPRPLHNHDTPNSTQHPYTLKCEEPHISVEVAYHCAQQVREVFHQATPTQGRRLAAHLIERLPTCPIPEIARLGRTLRKWKDAFLAYFDTGGASNGPTEAVNGHYRTRQTNRQRLPQPHQLPTPNAPHRRRPRRLHPHPTLKSR